jgi:RNA polymerase subunit RPABC4/transcription elongation factor Spt4
MYNTCVCCGRVIPEGSQVCPICVAESFDVPKRLYMEFNCPECGTPLKVLADYLIEERLAMFDSFGYERRDLIRHCNKCHCDWENEWWTEFGDVGESQLRRKFWG